MNISSKLLSFKFNVISEINQFGFSNVVKERPKKDICPFIYQYSNFNHEFDDIIPDNFDRKDHVEILWQIFSFDIQNEVTGVVLSGFDLESYYPSFFEIEIYFNNQGKILYDIVDFAISSKKPIVKVFAIKREACTFITGVNNEFIDYILKYVSDANEAIVENLKWDLEEYDIENSDKILEFLKNEQYKEYCDFKSNINDFRLDALIDTTYSIENLPEWLLCLFSDLLIRLTAIKQKTSSEIESVSIDSDILIISKVNSFKWIKNQNRIL